MSQLYAQFSLSLASVTFSTLNGGVSNNDEANSIEDIDGRSYLFSIASNYTFVTYGDHLNISNFFPLSPGYGATFSVATTGGVPDPSGLDYFYTSNISLTATLAPSDTNLAALNSIYSDGTGVPTPPNMVDEGIYNSVTSSITDVIVVPTLTANTIEVPNGVDPTTYIPNFYATLATASETLPPVDGASGQDTIYYPSYIWVPIGAIAGLDMSVYPGAPVMAALREYTNLSEVGYYLDPSPNHNGAGKDTWTGTLGTLLGQGWIVNPIYVGQQTNQDPSLTGQNYIETAPNTPAAQGVIDANQAMADASDFSAGTTIYLDVESQGQYVDADPKLINYIDSWCAQIKADGYSPGIYTLASAANVLAPYVSGYAPGTIYWISSTTNTLSSEVYTLPEATPFTVFPTDDPSGSDPSALSYGVNVVGWQYSINNANYYIPGVGVLPSVDFDTFINTGATQPPSESNGFDIFWRNSNGSLAEWLMNGSSISSSAAPTFQGTAVTPGSTWSVAGIGDFNGDGDDGLLWRNSNGSLATWLMDGSTIQSSAAPTYQGSAVSPDSSWSVAGIGDFTGNGDDDILWRQSSGALALWLMNGSTITSSQTVTYQGSPVNPDSSWSVAGIYDSGSFGIVLWRQNTTGDLVGWAMEGGTILVL